MSDSQIHTDFRTVHFQTEFRRGPVADHRSQHWRLVGCDLERFAVVTQRSREPPLRCGGVAPFGDEHIEDLPSSEPASAIASDRSAAARCREPVATGEGPVRRMPSHWANPRMAPGMAPPAMAGPGLSTRPTISAMKLPTFQWSCPPGRGRLEAAGWAARFAIDAVSRRTRINVEATTTGCDCQIWPGVMRPVS